MKLRVLWLGKTKDSSLTDLITDYAGRIRRFMPFEIVEIKEPRVDDSKRMAAEADKILAVVDSSDRVVLLDPAGKSWDTSQFAHFVAKHLREDSRRLTFVIGGFSGVTESVRARADLKLSLSPMTFTHDLSRVLLLEQIYRAFTIIHNHPYSR